MELTAINVNKIFEDCLFKTEPKPGTKFIHAQGIVANVGFDPNKIEFYANDIKQLLDNLNENFNESSGGGWSFLEACMTKDNVHWGEHKSVEQLMLLGIASGWVKYLFPREMWNILAGGMPCFVVVNERTNVEEEVYAV